MNSTMAKTARQTDVTLTIRTRLPQEQRMASPCRCPRNRGPSEKVMALSTANNADVMNIRRLRLIPTPGSMTWRKQSNVPRPRTEETWLGPKPPLVTLSDSWPNFRFTADKVENRAIAPMPAMGPTNTLNRQRTSERLIARREKNQAAIIREKGPDRLKLRSRRIRPMSAIVMTNTMEGIKRTK